MSPGWVELGWQVSPPWEDQPFRCCPCREMSVVAVLRWCLCFSGRLIFGIAGAILVNRPCICLHLPPRPALYCPMLKRFGLADSALPCHGITARHSVNSQLVNYNQVNYKRWTFDGIRCCYYMLGWFRMHGSREASKF